MARSNGPFGPPGARMPPRRHPADDPYAPPPPAQVQGQWPSQGHPDQGHAHGQGGQNYHFPPESEPNYGYNQQPPQHWGSQPDPRGYDLGNYPPGSQPYPPADPAQYQQGPHHGSYGAQQGYGENEAYDDEYVDDAEEPRRGRRWMLIAAALVGAIGVGGALAYTYKSLVAPNSGRVPWVKASDANVKVKPENRGGKEFANTDKRMLGRLGDDGGQKSPAATEAPDDKAGEDGGPRRVKTIQIPVGGPPAAEAPPPSSSVPGIMLENIKPRTQPAAESPPKAAPPGRVALGQPPPLLAPSDEVEPSPPPPARRAPVQIPPVAARPPPTKGTEAPPPAATGLGYVAVLSSQKSRMDALKVFADLQQKYADVLAGKPPDVLEADLSARGLGTVYRLVVGPPGSRDGASGLCSQLKAAGLKDCWVTAY